MKIQIYHLMSHEDYGDYGALHKSILGVQIVCPIETKRWSIDYY